MSGYGYNNPPLLPPRSPQPARHPAPSASPAGYPIGGYPVPPPGPPHNPDSLADPQPPPIPPRPPGYEITTTTAQSNPAGQPILGFPIPPPPPGPPPGIVRPASVNSLPSSHLQPYTPRLHHSHAYSPAQYSTPSPQSQNGFNIPPPPPGPPPRNNTSPISQNLPPFPQLQYMPQSLAGPYSPQPPTQPPTASQTPGQTPISSPAIQISSGETPNSPPPTYTPLNKNPDTQEPSRALDSVAPSMPSHIPVSHSTPYHQYSPPAPPLAPSPAPAPASQPPMVASPQPNPEYQTYQVPQRNPNHTPNAPGVPSPSTPSVTQPDHEVYELPAEPSIRGHPVPPSAEPLPALAPPAVTSCIDGPVSFATDWYWHPSAPDFLICSRCYVDRIHGTRFWDAFRRERLADGKARVCRFSRPRMDDVLFPDALATGSLETALTWMRNRSKIPDCKGVDGVKGTAGIKWYRTKANEIPGFVACEACWEDHVKTRNFFVNFEPMSPQPAGENWYCDIAVTFIQKEYELRGKANDWSGFVAEAKARMGIQACPGRAVVKTKGRKWFVPKTGPDGLVLCSGCYCDEVLHTGEEAKWEVSEKFTDAADAQVRCAMGIFSIKMAMARAQETKDFQSFWTAVHKLSNVKFCLDDEGIEDGVWYSLPSDPQDFAICAGCYVAIAEPLGVARFFVRKREPQPEGVKWRCCFSLGHPRIGQFVPRLLELYFTHDPTSLEEFASVYASILPCPRDEDVKNRRWYGWMDCTICPECYQDFAKRGPLAAKMDLISKALEESTICEMYSPRMRKLYTECSDTSPPDPAPLLRFSVQRRLVWMQTVPQMRTLLIQAKIGLDQQRFLNATSSFYNNAGMLQDITYGSPYTYGAPGVGYGFANANLLQGAMYSQQAFQVANNAAGPDKVFLVGQLERRWRDVE
ncbi:hypothetical protein F5Y04DRAFT_53174 [Hypomontagnella monticulosa]|nr:hypothetical protein F5Y04DRAFT_53174 [Hypomontagnella monticulosa]